MSTTESDEVLYGRFLEGDKAALDQLLERHGNSLTLFLRGYVDSMEDAEDLMMDSFVAIAMKKSWAAKGSTFKTWLFAIGRNLALMHMRRRKRTVCQDWTMEASMQDTGEHPEMKILQDESRRTLFQALDHLKEEYREVLYLMYFDEMTVEEICQVMNRSKTQVYHLTTRGREALRRELELMGFDDRVY